MKPKKQPMPPPEAEAPESAAETQASPQDWEEVAGSPETDVTGTAAPESAAPDPLAEACRERDDIKAKYLYLQAEYQNYRKRVAKDLADARAYATADTLGPFLTVFDYLAMAENAADKSDNLDALKQGLKMIIAEYRKAFDELGVKPLEAAGAKFDPELHEAVAHEPSDCVPEGLISKVWSSGYKIGDRLLRPARVVVSAGPAAEESPAAPEAEKGE